MQKFELGDVIIANGKVYYARIVGDKETLFEAKSIAGMFGAKYSGCGNSEGFNVKCEDYLIIGGECIGCSKTFDDKLGKLMPQGVGDYPIVGTYNRRGILWNLPRLKSYYPDLYNEFIALQVDPTFYDSSAARSVDEHMRMWKQRQEALNTQSKDDAVKLALAKTPEEVTGIKMTNRKKAAKKTTKKR